MGLLLGLLSFPTSLHFHKKPLALVITAKSFWWSLTKGSRAKTCGNVILLGPNILKNDLEHELVHIRQGDRYPFIFPFLYYSELHTKGYKANKFEKEAYKISNSIYKEK